jgi:outer membrane protein TolC
MKTANADSAKIEEMSLRAKILLAAVGAMCALSLGAQQDEEIVRPVVPKLPRYTLAAPYFPNATSAQNPYFGSVTAKAATDETLKLTLDDAVRRGFETNLGLKQAEANEKAAHGQHYQAMQLFLPDIHMDGLRAYRETNLVALGFGPGLVEKLGQILPGGIPPGLSFITKADVTEGSVSMKQTLFSGPIIDVFKAAGALDKVQHFARMTARGEVVQQVATAYLRALATESEAENARALAASDKVLFDHAHEMHVAGVGTNLDELRARVAWQAQEQRVIEAENAHEKALILLKREIGLAPGQPVQLTDPTPYSELAVENVESLRATAYQSRQDYQRLKAQLREAEAARAGYSHQRWPTLTFNGRYAVTAVNGVGTHGNFAAIGELSVPVFHEATLRGDVEIARAQERAAQAQLADIRDRIDQQVRSTRMDVDAAAKLVEVARSNVELARQALDDEKARYEAGIDDNLPLVQAQSSLAAAETNLVESELQYNLAKLALARSAGVIELQYKRYLGN